MEKASDVKEVLKTLPSLLGDLAKKWDERTAKYIGLISTHDGGPFDDGQRHDGAHPDLVRNLPCRSMASGNLNRVEWPHGYAGQVLTNGRRDSFANMVGEKGNGLWCNSR